MFNMCLKLMIAIFEAMATALNIHGASKIEVLFMRLFFLVLNKQYTFICKL